MTSKISETAARENLKRLYGTTASDFITVEEIFANAGRAEMDLESNRTWLYNKLSAMLPYNLFEKRFTVRNRNRTIEGIILTSRGRSALGRDSLASIANQPQPIGRKPTFESVKADVEILRTEFPALKITFDVRLDEGTGQN